MGWFEDQVKKRKTLDEKTFEDSFLSLAGVGEHGRVSENSAKENFAITQILNFFRVHEVDIPTNINSLKEKLIYAVRPHDVSYHNIEFNLEVINAAASPLLAFAKAGHIPVALIPKGNKGYYYVSPRTGKRTKLNPEILDKFEPEAYSFYRPLPGRKVSIKEYIGYLRKSSRPLDTALIAIMAAAVAGIGLLMPYLTKTITGPIVQNQDLPQFLLFAVYVVGAATGLLLVKAFQGFISSRISIRRDKAIKEATMMRVLSLPPAFFKKYNTGELSARFNAVPLLASTLINGVFAVAMSAVMSIAYLFQMAGFAPVLILPVILILIASNGFTILVAVLQKNYSKKVLELNSKENGVSYEIINGIQKIRLSGSEKRVFAKWANIYSKAARVQYNPPLILRLSPALSLLITLLGNLLIYYVASKNQIEASDYMAFVTSYGVLSSSFAALGQMVGVIANVQPLYEMARPILVAEPENNQDKAVLEGMKGEIHFDSVCFRYNDNSPLILDKLSLDIHEGEYIAIVGQTGCGKSTFVRLLLGFERPTSGRIFYDGMDMEELDLSSLRRNIGTVMQNGSLFHADILSNIIISSPDLGEEEAWKAAEIADIADDIRAMPMKMKTVISEGQGGISGGQKQRIMIARAIVHKPKILIFDEATSALDNKTQNSISQSIAKLNCTRIVIAHRLSTIKQADRILMLEGGKIIESGDYETLIAQNGKFAELVDRQRLDK